MKQANNNEVDLLLRSFAKGRDDSALRSASASAGGNGAFPEHLDTDELNSYAEGVAPAAARARYTAHLADCEACRRIVIDLSQAAGAVNRIEVSRQESGPGFWQKLAAVFSPAVLRFAVPAVVLAAVIGIVLVGVQQQRLAGLVALNEQRAVDARTPSGGLKQAEATTANSSSGPQAVAPKAGESPTVNDSIAGKNNRVDKTADPAAPDVETGAFATTPAAKDGTARGKAGEVAQSQPFYALEPKVGADAPPPATVQTEKDDTLDLAKEQSAKREEQERRQRDDFRNQPSDEHGPNRAATQRSGPSNNSQQNVGGFILGRSGPNAENKKAKVEDKAKPSEVETQYVSGRTFAREGNAWVDTAYESSRATIKVKRGSEQFRALVADEPGLGAIANQLKGVVVVVWKNRAYRIQ